ncbi:MAG: histidine kinase [Frankiales bacterium]|nr:histidine kinase [Frankiales bacterium]
MTTTVPVPVPITDSTPLPKGRDAVAGRLRQLVIAMTALVLLVGLAGVLAIQLSTSVTAKLTRGYTPATDAHNSALTTMLDIETGTRGYILTANREFLEPYTANRTKISGFFDTVGASLDSVGQHDEDAAITTERDRAQAWLTTYADPIAKSTKVKTDPSLPDEVQGKALFDAFRQANAAVTSGLSTKRNDLRAESRRLRGLAVPLLLIAIAIAVLLALWLAVRAAAGISSPLTKLWQVVRRLDDGDLQARADEDDGPSEVRALARSVNALSARARADVIAELDAEQFRQRTRLISSTIRRTTNGNQMAEHLVRGLGDAFEADRSWLHTFPDDRVPDLTAQWHLPRLTPLPTGFDFDTVANRALAIRLWESAHAFAVDDFRVYQPIDGDSAVLKVAQAANVRSALVVPIGDSSGPFGLLWVAMAGHARHWGPRETGVAQHLAADLAHGLVQAHLIERQAQAVQLLRELDQAKADFISTVSHELRTPLTSISGYLEMVRDGDGGTLPEGAVKMLTVVDRNAIRLRNLIEDLLTQSRIDAGRLRLDIALVDLVAVLRIVNRAMLPLASSAGVVLEFDLAPPGALILEADAAQLEQVFTNLVSNSIKFTPAGGTVSVVATKDTDEDGVFVQVADTGMGIPETDFAKLFTRFFRASNASAAAVPGTGLGLAIVQEIVQRHGGAIDLESQVNKGTTFNVWLPSKAPLPLP